MTMKYLIEGIGNLLMWLGEHNLRPPVEIILRVKSNTEMYAGNAELKRGEPPEFPHFMGRERIGTTICGVPVRFEVDPR
jgi:hypothetical protein